jgi:hypothetical protein
MPRQDALNPSLWRVRRPIPTAEMEILQVLLRLAPHRGPQDLTGRA